MRLSSILALKALRFVFNTVQMSHLETLTPHIERTSKFLTLYGPSFPGVWYTQLQLLQHTGPADFIIPNKVPIETSPLIDKAHIDLPDQNLVNSGPENPVTPIPKVSDSISTELTFS